jgi:hypothetical protein
MAANITASSGNASGSAERMVSPRGMEIVKLVGVATAAGDTSNSYQCKTIQKPAIVIGGAFTGAVSGNTITFTSLIALGSNTVYVIVAETL